MQKILTEHRSSDLIEANALLELLRYLKNQALSVKQMVLKQNSLCSEQL